MQKPDETVKSKLKGIRALWDTRILKQVVDVGEMERRCGDHRGDMQFITDLLHKSEQLIYRAPDNIQLVPQVPNPECQAQIDSMRASHELIYRSMERQVKTIENKYGESKKELRASRLRARNAEKQARKLEAEISRMRSKRTRESL